MARGSRTGFGGTSSNQRSLGNTMIDHQTKQRSKVNRATGDAPQPRKIDNLRDEKILGRFFVKDRLSGKKSMEVVYVTSSNLVMAVYAHDRKVLRIQFKNGSMYDYYGVPPRVFEVLKKVGSKGRFHYRSIRRSYAYKRVR